MGRGLLEAPYRVLAPSANSQGKTSGSAALSLWWFCTRSPAIIRTTAPKFDQVRDLLWKEIRRLARRLKTPLPFLPKACRIERSEDDYAVGATATGESGWKGHHGPNQLFIFDEATDVADEFWTATETMFQPPGHAWLAIFNPTSTSSRVYLEFSRVDSAGRRGEAPAWNVVRMSALDHPNLEAELKGLPPVVPDAMRAARFGELLAAWSTVVDADPTIPVGSPGGPEAGDVVWPPVWATTYRDASGNLPEASSRLENIKNRPSGPGDNPTAISGVGPYFGQVSKVYRPGPEAEACLLARFPSQGTSAVWGDADWLSACRDLPGMSPLEWDTAEPVPVPELGCDVARFGDDYTEIHARSGPISLLHESAAKRPTDATTGRLIEVAQLLAEWYNDAIQHLPDSKRPGSITRFEVPIKIDDDGVGGGVSDALVGMRYNVTRITAQSAALEAERYPNKRSELWFVTAERARTGALDLSGLDADIRDELRRQALTCTWSLNGQGQRVVMPKDKIKAELKRSPDGLDAMNLAYYPGQVSGPSTATTEVRIDPFRSGVFGGLRR
jgi:hypothetical protein